VLAEDGRKRRASVIEHMFLRYGAGAKLFDPLTSWRLWNRFCWTLIVIGFLGWVAALWLLRGLSE